MQIDGGKPPTTPHSREADAFGGGVQWRRWAEAFGGGVRRRRWADALGGHIQWIRYMLPPSQNSLINNKFISIVYYIQRTNASTLVVFNQPLTTSAECVRLPKG